MRKLLVLFVFCFFLLCVSCRPATKQEQLPIKTANSDDDSQKNNFDMISGGIGLRAEITEKNAVDYLKASLKSSYFVLEGTVTKKETLNVGAQYGDWVLSAPWDMYTMEDLTVITGCYEQETITLQDPHGDIWGPWAEFAVGRRYIVIVWSNDTVFQPEGKILYQTMNVRIQLDAEDASRISYCNMEGKSIPIQTKQEVLSLVEETIGFTKEHYQSTDLYIRSDEISELVQTAPIIAKIKVTEYEPSVPHPLAVTCPTSVIRLYKDDSTCYENAAKIVFPVNSVEEGKEYLVLLQRAIDWLDKEMQPIYGDRYIVAAKKNCVIPMDDTKRVNEVYAALGIEPEE